MTCWCCGTASSILLLSTDLNVTPLNLGILGILRLKKLDWLIDLSLGKRSVPNMHWVFQDVYSHLHCVYILLENALRKPIFLHFINAGHKLGQLFVLSSCIGIEWLLILHPVTFSLSVVCNTCDSFPWHTDVEKIEHLFQLRCYIWSHVFIMREMYRIFFAENQPVLHIFVKSLHIPLEMLPPVWKGVCKASYSKIVLQ